MEHNAIEIPILTLYEERDQPKEAVYPACFIEFRNSFGDSVAGSTKQDQGITDAESVVEELPPPNEADKLAVENFAVKTVQAYHNHIGKPQFGEWKR